MYLIGVMSTYKIRVFSGTALSDALTTLANQQTVPSAVTVPGQRIYRIEHTQANVAQTDHEGFSIGEAIIHFNFSSLDGVTYSHESISKYPST